MFNVTYKDKKIDQVLISGMELYHFQQALYTMRRLLLDNAATIRKDIPDLSVNCAFENTLEKIAQG